MVQPMPSPHRWPLAFLAAFLGCGKASSPARDGGQDRIALGGEGDLANEGATGFDAPGDSSGRSATDTAGAGQPDATADVGVSDAVDVGDGASDADDPRCLEPGPGACVCDGFVMPNPAGAGLPNPARYELVGSDQVVDDVSGLAWERSPSAMKFTQASAVTHCLASTTGGESGWRLPTAVELVSIHDFTSEMGLATPFLVMSVPAGTFHQSWSSSHPGFAGSLDGLGVQFDSPYNEVFPSHADDPFPARCVRTGGAPPPRCYRAGARFALDSDDIATDHGTGLVWQRHTMAVDLTWSAARAACANASGSWRLPSVHELYTIVDHERVDPSLDPVVFPGTPLMTNNPGIPNTEFSTYWTSSPLAGDATKAWVVDFAAGYSAAAATTLAAHVRCVR
jgi:hypothetical protein